MPLPDADDAKKSNLYAQLRSSQLDSVTQANFDKVKDPVYLNAAFEDEARRLKLWGEIAGKLSSSGPLAGGGTYVEVAVAATGHILVYQPDPGEVYVLMNAQIANTGSESFSASLSLHAAADFSQGVPIDNSISGTTNQSVDMLNSPVYVSNELFLGAYFGTVGASGNEVKLALHRVR